MNEIGWGEGYECAKCRCDMEIAPFKSLIDPVKIRCPQCKQTALIG